jgi:hypothetical protein
MSFSTIFTILFLRKSFWSVTIDTSFIFYTPSFGHLSSCHYNITKYFLLQYTLNIRFSNIYKMVLFNCIAWVHIGLLILYNKDNRYLIHGGPRSDCSKKFLLFLWKIFSSKIFLSSSKFWKSGILFNDFRHFSTYFYNFISINAANLSKTRDVYFLTFWCILFNDLGILFNDIKNTNIYICMVYKCELCEKQYASIFSLSNHKRTASAATDAIWNCIH